MSRQDQRQGVKRFINEILFRGGFDSWRSFAKKFGIPRNLSLYDRARVAARVFKISGDKKIDSGPRPQ